MATPCGVGTATCSQFVAVGSDALSPQGNADCPARTVTTVQRRQFLSLAAVGLAGCVGASGGSGPRNPPTTPEGGGPVETTRGLRIVDGTPREGEDGALMFVITVENTADSSRSDTLVGRATIETDEGTAEYEASREVSLDADTAAEIDLVFDVAYETWAGASAGLSYGWQGEL